jgi:hypothetical protein
MLQTLDHPCSVHDVPATGPALHAEMAPPEFRGAFNILFQVHAVWLRSYKSYSVADAFQPSVSSGILTADTPVLCTAQLCTTIGIFVASMINWGLRPPVHIFPQNLFLLVLPSCRPCRCCMRAIPHTCMTVPSVVCWC